MSQHGGIFETNYQFTFTRDEDSSAFLSTSHSILVTFGFAILAIVISIRLILRHLRHFHQPVIQRKIIAILWMVPVYSLTSWFSLVYPEMMMVLDMVFRSF